MRVLQNRNYLYNGKGVMGLISKEEVNWVQNTNLNDILGSFPFMYIAN